MAESDARLSQSRLQAAKSELITVTEDAEAANMLAEGLKQQLEARDAKLNKLNAALVETRLECEEQEQRLSEKDRELLQTKHAFRMHIRRLEVCGVATDGVECRLSTSPMVVLPDRLT